jgi:hypothetical protein
MTTKEAFAALCNNKEKCQTIGLNDSTRRSYLTYVKTGKNLSTDKMEELLIKSGAKVKQEKLWKLYPIFCFFFQGA